VALFASTPEDHTFLSLLQQAGGNIEMVTQMLDRLMRSWPDEPELRTQIKHLEHENDRITHDVLHQLYAPSSAPSLEREDVHALAAALDDVVDYAEETADVLGLYKIEAPMEQAVELTGVLRDCGAQIAAALGSLEDLEAVTGHVTELGRLEDEGDRISRQALVSLFAGGIDPMVVIRWKDVFERLEQAIDSCERVAHVLEGIVVKQS
jgi:uncharacterized protein